MKTFHVKTQLMHGTGALTHLRTLKAHRACIVTDAIMKKIGVAERVGAELKTAGISYKYFDGVEVNPSLETIQMGLHHIIEYKPDVLIAIGGGSVIDAAKAIMYFCIKTKEMLLDKGQVEKPLFIAIPTTSGTGSEVTSFSVITDHKSQRKIALTDDLMLPDLAILDATLTLTVPVNVSVDTGFDVIAHAIEAYVSVNHTVYSDLFAQKALGLAFDNLLKVFYDGSQLEPRQAMHDASCMAGIAFNNSGLGINHSLAHVIGGRFGVSHGRANAVLLPHIMTFNQRACSERYSHIAKSIGLSSGCDVHSANALIEHIKHLLCIANIPSGFREFGIDRQMYTDALEEMASKAMEDVCTVTNPVAVTKEQLKELLHSVF